MSIEVNTDIPAVLKDYDLLSHKPKINGNELTGNKTSAQLGIKEVVSAAINANGHLILTLNDASAVDCGEAKGDKGDMGETGATGAAGAPGEKGDKGDPGTFFVTFTGYLSENNSSLTSDKTYAEMLAAKAAGYLIVGIHMGMPLYLSWLDGNYESQGAVFKSQPSGSGNAMSYYNIKCTSDGGYTPEVTYCKMSIADSSLISGTTLTVSDRGEYRGTDITALTVTYPEGSFECWLKLTFAAAGTIAVTFPQSATYIGTAPTFANGETWEISIKDGVIIAAKVGDGT